ncbi:MAG: polysaccharide biosynthesis tyrosine autokinase [Chromatiaceae bacterium]|nr:polysaccharide biosynthesis tyrosine autokinase [Chromatiaceae bacterium]
MSNISQPPVPAEGLPPGGPLARPGQRALAPRPQSQVPAVATAAPDEEDFIDLRHLWGILLRRKGTVLLAAALVVLIGLIYTFTATPIYRGTLLMQIERQEGQVVKYKDVTPDEDARSGQDFYQTQYELLKSRNLARRVIDQLGLEPQGRKQADEASESFLGNLAGSFQEWLAGILGAETKATDDPGQAEPDLPPGDQEKALLANLNIEPVRNSRLVKISYESPRPAEAAAVPNAIANNFINMNLERRFEASSYATRFLQEQLQQARVTLEDSEKRLVQYSREREIIDSENRLSTLMARLQEMTTSLVKAEAARIESEAAYLGLTDANNPGVAGMLDSQAIEKLKGRRAELQAEYEQNLEVYKPGYPKMQQIQRQIADIDKTIAKEVAAIAGSIRLKFETRQREEAKLNQRIAEIKEEVLTLQDRSTDHQTLKREVDTNRELYEGLLQRLKEVGVTAGIGTNNVSVVDPAEVPIRPYKPSLPKNLAIALVLGLLLGVGLAYLLETLDDSIKTSEDAERRLGVPVLGLMPMAAGEEYGLEAETLALLVNRDPKSPLAEAARSLRTSLLFSTSEGAPRICHFTSASPSEGKTTSAVVMAIIFAQAGGKVLLIDADLRNPSLHRTFGLANTEGLTNFLAGDIEPAKIARPTEVARLFTITSGPLPPNPVELLSSPKMLDLLHLAVERFDYVIIDGPPVIGLADALVLANLASATIFAIHTGETRAGAMEGAVKRLRGANAHVIGGVMTMAGRPGGGGYGYGYGYSYDYHYTYTYGNKSGAEALPDKAGA